MRVVRFRYRGKVAHFLRAEANVDGLTYPVPPRTALLGVAGAVLGLGKDEPQEALARAEFAVAGVGPVPLRFWHTTNVRKDPPAPLPLRVSRTARGTDSEQRNMRFAQEWLWKPDFRVWAALPGEYHAAFLGRLAERRWHFTPCLGLAWMFAELDEAEELEAEPLKPGVHKVATVAPQEAGSVAMQQAFAGRLTLQSLRMACAVTAGRAFSHRAYWLEIGGRPFPFETSKAFQCGEAAVVWL
jgi:CRISPR-associated protein Cas5h